MHDFGIHGEPDSVLDFDFSGFDVGAQRSSSGAGQADQERADPAGEGRFRGGDVQAGLRGVPRPDGQGRWAGSVGFEAAAAEVTTLAKQHGGKFPDDYVRMCSVTA